MKKLILIAFLSLASAASFGESITAANVCEDIFTSRLFKAFTCQANPIDTNKIIISYKEKDKNIDSEPHTSFDVSLSAAQECVEMPGYLTPKQGDSLKELCLIALVTKSEITAGQVSQIRSDYIKNQNNSDVALNTYLALVNLVNPIPTKNKE